MNVVLVPKGGEILVDYDRLTAMNISNVVRNAKSSNFSFLSTAGGQNVLRSFLLVKFLVLCGLVG